MAVIAREDADVDHIGMLMGGNLGKNTIAHVEGAKEE